MALTSTQYNTGRQRLLRLLTDGGMDITQQDMDRILGSRSGNAVAASDFALHANWGTGATVAVTAGSTDLAGEITVTAAGTPGANPTVILTFADGAFLVAPFAVSAMNGGTDTAAVITSTTSTTALTMTYVGTPTATKTVKITYIVSEGTTL